MELYRVFIDDTKMITKTVVVDVDGTISDELVSVEVPDPVTVGYYVVESEDILRNDIFKNMSGFQYEKLEVAYGDISQLQSAISNMSVHQMIDTLKSNLDEITFRNVLNFVFGKPLIDPPLISTDSLSGSFSGSPTGSFSGSLTGYQVTTAETPDITNAIKEHFSKDIPSLDDMIEKRQKELADRKLGSASASITATTTATMISTTPAGFSTFVENPPVGVVDIPRVDDITKIPETGLISGSTEPPLSPDILQQLKDERAKKQKIADQLYRDQIALVNFRNTLLPLLYAELQKFIQRDLEIAAQSQLKSGDLAKDTSASIVPTKEIKTSPISESRPNIPEETVIPPSDVVGMFGAIGTQQEILTDGTVIVQITTPTKIFTTSTNVGTQTLATHIMPELDTTSTFISQPMLQNEDVAKLFLGTSAPFASISATSPETLRRVPVVLPPPEKLPEEETQNRSEGVLPNFGESVMTQG